LARQWRPDQDRWRALDYGDAKQVGMEPELHVEGWTATRSRAPT